MGVRMVMASINEKEFNASSLSESYPKKTSLSRYKELTSVFPNTFIMFEHEGFYYGFDETAVALFLLFKYRLDIKKEMLVAKIDRNEFRITYDHALMRGYRYIVDKNGELLFVNGKPFYLKTPLSDYKKLINNNKIHQKKQEKTTPQTENDTKHGGGWYDDVWTPGLPSSRFYKKSKTYIGIKNRTQESIAKRPYQTVTEHDVMITKNTSNKNAPRIGIGSTVTLESISDGEIIERTLISSNNEVFYKTMGYKTKNYTEITRTSDADGYSTISDASPLGKAIIGKRIGDFAEFTVKGKKAF